MLVRESTAQRRSVKEEESESVGRVNACCQIERDREGRGQKQRGEGEGGKGCECLRAQRGEERQFGLSQVERERERKAGREQRGAGSAALWM